MKHLFLLLWMGLSLPAWAQDSSQERARVLYENGSTLYEEGQYESAILAFKEGYELSRMPAFLYNIANSYERLGELDQALSYLNQYRAFAPAEERERLERRIRAIEHRQEELAAAAAAASTAAPPTTTSVTQTAPETAVPPTTTGPSEVPSGSGGGGRLGPALLGVGGGLVLLGGGTAALTYSRSQVWIVEDDQATYERWRPVNLVGIGAAGVGAGLVVAGGVGLVARRVAVQPTPGGSVLHLNGSF